MTKYYYTDPLKAAYMAREFGVEFVNEQGAELVFLDPGGWHVFYGDNDLSIFGGLKLFIHPDSYPIFEPRESDVILDTFKNEPFVIRENQPTEIFIPDRWQIIMRDNKQFFMPEEK